MTRKELNRIRHAAYLEWAETPEAQEMLKRSNEFFKGWKITEHVADQFITKILVTEHDSQVNNETLKAMGFTPAAEVRQIFEINRKTKTLTPTGWA